MYYVKYDNKKKCGKGEKPKNSNPSSSATHSTSQKGSSVLNLVCFKCKKPYSKGHVRNARLSRLNTTTVGQLATIKV